MAYSNGIFCNISKSIKYLFVLKNISECWNCNVAMKYFAIFDKSVATIFQLQWNIENIPVTFLQYSVICGYIKLLIIFIWKFAIFLSWKLALWNLGQLAPASLFYLQQAQCHHVWVCDNLPLVATSPGLLYSQILFIYLFIYSIHLIYLISFILLFYFWQKSSKSRVQIKLCLPWI